jgi:branched-chain amino acid transport system ATP-binding protein
MPILEVRNVTKKFGELVALNNVNISIEKNECRGIIGPNGAGKTTLFNIISGFMKPTSGRIMYKGRDITGVKPHNLVKLGLVRTFQIVKVFKNLTVYENFMVISDNPDEIIRQIGLWDKRDFLAADLPHGDLRRLNIGLAITLEPEVLLLDEPFSGLSPKESMELSKLIDELRDQGVTLVIIEHKLRELFTHADKVTVLNSGIVISEGTPKEVVNDKNVIEAYLGIGYSE